MQVAAPFGEHRLKSLVSTSSLRPLLHGSLLSDTTPSLAQTGNQCSQHPPPHSPHKSLLGPSREKSTNKHRGEAGAAQRQNLPEACGSDT